jgi:alkylhydroperoxidase family enzyme
VSANTSEDEGIDVNSFDGDSGFTAVVGDLPRVARWLLPVSAILRRGTTASTVEPRLRAMVALRVSAIDGSGYWLERQTRAAAEIGVAAEEIERIRGGEWSGLATLSDRERAALRWAEAVAVNEAKRDREAFSDLERHFDEAEILELTALAGLSAMLDRLALALDLADDGPQEAGACRPVASEDLTAWAGSMFEEEGT